MRRSGRFVGARLQKRLFKWFGAAILLTSLVAATAAALTVQGGGWSEQTQRFEEFASQQFAQVWEEPTKRDALARDLAEVFAVRITLLDTDGEALSQFGGECGYREHRVVVRRDAVPMGAIVACQPPNHWGGARFVLVLLVSGMTLWGLSGLLARRIARPLRTLVEVTRDIGAGKLDRRAPESTRYGEVGELAEAINEMTSRIQAQMKDQRELLAAVSHEVRTPLARMRVMLELARDEPLTQASLDRLEGEVIEIDELVGRLLASSRLDFQALNCVELDAKDAAKRALSRAALPPELLRFDDASASSRFLVDATLLARALDNLLDNAKRHGDGATGLHLEVGDATVVFTVEDGGPGFDERTLPRAFESFSRGAGRGRTVEGSLGLGLSLVRRIARAHGGDAHARNLPEGGAAVTLTFPRTPASGAESSSDK